MAELVSPGVSIELSNESFYATAGTGTVPLIVIATAKDKPSPAGGTAAFTTDAVAGNVKLITSQRELLSNYGNPSFKTLGGTPLHGDERNEYGLQAAYSFLGIANRAYVLRADVDLDALTPSAAAPTAKPSNGSYWLDSDDTVWGLKRWGGAGTGWVKQSVLIPGANDVDGSNVPLTAFGQNGQYCVVFVSNTGATVTTGIKLYQKISSAWLLIDNNGTFGSSHDFQVGPHTTIPTVQSGGGALSVGDLFLQTSKQNNGSDVILKRYDASAGQFVSENIVGKVNSYEAYGAYPSVTAGDIWVDYDKEVANISIKRHNGASNLVADTSASLSGQTWSATQHVSGSTAFEIVVNDNDVVNGSVNGVIPVTLFGKDSDSDGNLTLSDVITGIQDAISVATPAQTGSDLLSVANVAGRIAITVSGGKDIRIQNGSLGNGFNPLTELGFDAHYSNWEIPTFTASANEITGSLANGTLWYDSSVSNSSIDILYNNAGTWTTYPYDVNIAASEPSTQRDGTSALVDGDLWISSADLENYPKIYKRASGAWVLVDSADQDSGDGIVFADFREAPGSATLDADAPQASLYPYDILAWNKRFSGGNVKQWTLAHRVGNTLIGNRWVDYSGNKDDGSPYLLRKAQRRAVVKGLQSVINSNQDIRNESNRFNLIAAPGYPELMDEMVSLSGNRKETAFVIADAPLRLKADATSTAAWATNANNATSNGEDGLVSNFDYAAVYYPHGKTSDLAGNDIVVPASHIALRTIAFNDQVAFPWFAPAGFQRGVVSNASGVGYIDPDSGEFKAVSLSEGQRDGLYINRINPIAQFPGRGLAIFGQKTLSGSASALDRVNVARLVVYLRERLDDIVKPFLFEPNDEITRQNAKVLVDRFLGNLVSQRGLYDFVTVCDSSNNTPARIDRNELYIDIAIQPVKAVEFIYIPIRVQNTLGQTN